MQEKRGKNPISDLLEEKLQHLGQAEPLYVVILVHSFERGSQWAKDTLSTLQEQKSAYEGLVKEGLNDVVGYLSDMNLSPKNVFKHVGGDSCRVTGVPHPQAC